MLKVIYTKAAQRHEIKAYIEISKVPHWVNESELEFLVDLNGAKVSITILYNGQPLQLSDDERKQLRYYITFAYPVEFDAPP